MRPDQVQQRAGGGRECPPRLAQPPAGGGPSGRDARAPEFHQRQSGLDQRCRCHAEPGPRNAIWGQIDQQVMKDAVIVPIVYAEALIYRPPTLSNVYFNQAYQADNYAVMGLTG